MKHPPLIPELCLNLILPSTEAVEAVVRWSIPWEGHSSVGQEWPWCREEFQFCKKWTLKLCFKKCEVLKAMEIEKSIEQISDFNDYNVMKLLWHLDISVDYIFWSHMQWACRNYPHVLTIWSALGHAQSIIKDLSAAVS